MGQMFPPSFYMLCMRFDLPLIDFLHASLHFILITINTAIPMLTVTLGWSAVKEVVQRPSTDVQAAVYPERTTAMFLLRRLNPPREPQLPFVLK